MVKRKNQLCLLGTTDCGDIVGQTVIHLRVRLEEID